jgi:hypothetical protein
MNIVELIKKLEICPICGTKTIYNVYANILFCPSNPLRCEVYLTCANKNNYDLYLYIGEKIILQFSKHNEYVAPFNNHPFDKLNIKDIFSDSFKTKLRTVMLLG